MKKKKYVRCIDNNRGQYNLTIGKVYEVMKETNTYWVINDCGDDLNYPIRIFQLIGCPCRVDTCLKHRAK